MSSETGYILEVIMQRGDHLITPRKGYEHHGLYLGDNEVIHHSGFSELFKKGPIQITSLEDFEQGNPCRVFEHEECKFCAEERIARALEQHGRDDYNLVFNNCEHFVNYCFGEKKSEQVRRTVKYSSIAASALLSVGAAGIYAFKIGKDIWSKKNSA